MLESENCQVPDPSNTDPNTDPNDPNQNTDPNGPSVEIASVDSYTNTITVTYTLTNVDEGYDGYLVTYWKDNENVDAHTPATINTTACSATICTITGLTPATKYNIRVYAKKTGFTSAYKNTAATTQASSGGNTCIASASSFTNCGKCSTSGKKICYSTDCATQSREVSCTPCVPSYTSCSCGYGSSIYGPNTYHCTDVNHCSSTTDVPEEILGTLPSGKACCYETLHSQTYCSCMSTCLDGDNLGGHGDTSHCYTDCKD